MALIARRVEVELERHRLARKRVSPNVHARGVGCVAAQRRLVRTISVALPISSGDRNEQGDQDQQGNGSWFGRDHRRGAFGAQPTSVAVVGSVAYVSLYTANAIAVVDLSGGASDAILGYIPTASAPGTVVYDAAHNQLVVSNDKGIGAQSNQVNSHGAGPAYNTHEDQATVSLIALPNYKTLRTMTTQVFQNNHWDLRANISAASGGNPWERAVAIPRHIGDPSKIKHVFLIVRENRTLAVRRIAADPVRRLDLIHVGSHALNQPVVAVGRLP